MGSARRAPLTLLASKSWIGHAEPAAGVVGITHSQLALAAAHQLPIMHLGNVNQYVTAMMHKSAGSWSIPRQAAALGAGKENGPTFLCGVSAFAFQGTNAHVLLQTSQPQDGLDFTLPKAAGPWRSLRHWVSPAVSR